MIRFRKAALLVLPLVLGSAACSDPELVSPTLDGPAFAKVAAPVEGSQDLESTYLVRFRGQADVARFGMAVGELGGEVIFAHEGAGIAAVTGLSPVRALMLSKRADIAAVDADATVELEEVDASLVAAADAPESPTNPAGSAFYGRQWNMRAISAPAAWAAGSLGLSSIKVGILDTGIDYLHPDLAGRVDLGLSRSFLSAAENARVPAGAHLMADLNYHGTHVAVTVASNGYLAGGVNSGVTLVGLKVCSPGTAANGFRGSCPTSGTLAAILYAADNGIPIINMSLGGAFNRRQASAAGGFGPSFLATINQVMNYANRKGTTVVVSAGNSALDIDHDGNGYKSYCSAAQVICVSATGPTFAQLFATPAHPVRGEYLNIQNIDALAGYSNYGRSAINVAAPGGNAIPVWAACSGFTIHPSLTGCRTRYYNSPTSWSGSVVGLSGTSMAAPHVAGLLALIASEIGSTHPAALRAALEKSADDLGQPGTDPAYGKGRINAARAVGL